MRNIWTIAKREYDNYFNSPIAYVVALPFSRLAYLRTNISSLHKTLPTPTHPHTHFSLVFGAPTTPKTRMHKFFSPPTTKPNLRPLRIQYLLPISSKPRVPITSMLSAISLPLLPSSTRNLPLSQPIPLYTITFVFYGGWSASPQVCSSCEALHLSGYKSTSTTR